MEAGWGWIDFSSKERDRSLSIMSLLRKPGVVDELGIGVLRDALSDTLFPGISTIQTRAKYFLFTPVIVRKYYMEHTSYSLSEYFALKESEFLEEMASNYRGKSEAGGNFGIYGITLDDAAKLQRKPSSIYWNGQQILGFINNPLENKSFFNYLKTNTLPIDRSHRHSEDFADAGHHDQTGISLPVEIIEEFDPSSIQLNKSEAEYIKDTMIKTLQHNHEHSLLLSLLENKQLRGRFCKIKKGGFADFYYDTIETTNYFSETLKSHLTLAHDFSEITYGAHLLYNLLIQKKAANNEMREKHEKDFNKWLNDIRPHASIYNLTQHVALSSTISPNHKVAVFMVNWVNAIKKGKGNRAELEELIITQEWNSKTSRARLQKKRLPSEIFDKWIGMQRQDYRFSQAQTLLNDIDGRPPRDA